jgi:guanine nucleotide-binding protein subunit alpha, other
MFRPDYTPSNDDILRCRLRTTGTHEAEFPVQGLTYKMVDVGGQRSERKKWIHVFDNCQVVLFLAAISGYDQALPEDRHGVCHSPSLLKLATNWNQNQMEEALIIFDQVVNSKFFVNAAVILFLNKMDLFKEKLQSGVSPISRYFPDYQGGKKDIEAGKEFFARKFRRCIRNSEKELYTHYTNATDTTLLKVTMNSVQQIIVSKNLHNLIL